MSYALTQKGQVAMPKAIREAGARETILPDFMIGAQAEDIGAALITRDPRRYRSCFPDLKLIAP